MTRSHRLGLRIISLVLCLVCLFPVVRPVTASADKATMEKSDDYILTTIVRSRASASAPIIGRMENGTQVTVLGQKGKFYKVDCYDMKGYIAKSQIVHTEDDKYYVNCAEGSSETKKTPCVSYADALLTQHSLLALAKKQLGTRYVYGGSRPGGFDCSGLMYYIFGKHDIRLHRSASQQLQDGIIVSKEGMQVGDLVFFKEKGAKTLTSHVGMYAGNNQIIHAGSKGIEYADLDFSYFKDYFLCARRIVNTGAVQLSSDALTVDADGLLTVTSISGRTSR